LYDNASCSTDDTIAKDFDLLTAPLATDGSYATAKDAATGSVQHHASPLYESADGSGDGDYVEINNQPPGNLFNDVTQPPGNVYDHLIQDQKHGMVSSSGDTSTASAKYEVFGHDATADYC